VIRVVTGVMGDEGRHLWDHPHLRATYSAYTDLVCLDRFTHFAADMGSLQNDGWTLGRTLIEAAEPTRADTGTGPVPPSGADTGRGSTVPVT